MTCQRCETREALPGHRMVWCAEASASTVAAMQLDQKYSAATPEEQQKVEAWSDAQPTGSALA